MTDPITVLDYWLDEVGEDGWYKGSADIDADITARFAETWAAAAAGHLDHWIDGPAGTLAFLVVTDQFSRNIWRGQARAFDTDAQARAAARKAIAEGWDMDVPEPARQFFYLPFEHSEDMADQDLAVDLTTNRMTPSPDGTALHAQAHREIIRRFGRFPFRNAALGRTNTTDEAVFLAEGGYGAIVRGLKGG